MTSGGLVQPQLALSPSACPEPAWTPDEVPGVGLFRSVSLPAKSSSVPRVRKLTAEALVDWGLNRFVDDVSVCVTELAGNACRHAGDTEGAMVRVSLLYLVDRCLSLHIWDASSHPPVPRRQPELDEADAWDRDGIPVSGRGLHMVRVLSDGWGWWPLPAGKVVVCWFRAGALTEVLTGAAGKAEDA